MIIKDLNFYTERQDSDEGVVPLREIIGAEDIPNLFVRVTFEDNGRQVRFPICRVSPNGRAEALVITLPFSFYEADAVPMESIE